MRAPHEVPEYAQTFMDQKRFLDADEQLIGFYDVTIETDASESYLVTDKRLIHVTPTGLLAIPLSEVTSVISYDTGVMGWVYEVSSTSGEVITFEIPILNGIGKFGNMLKNALSSAGNPIDFEVPNKQ